MEKWNKLREECGVFGAALSGGEAAGLTYNALLALQHRGPGGRRHRRGPGGRHLLPQEGGPGLGGL